MDGDRPADGDRLKAAISRRVEGLLSVPQRHGRVFRLAWAAAGVILVLAGVAMTVFPGPAILVIPMGLAMLAGVFGWAHKLLSTSIERGVDMERWMQGLDLRVKVLGAAAIVCLVAAIAALVLLL